jgi:glutathione S-transferase
MSLVGKTRGMDDRYTAVVFTSRRRQDASAAEDGYDGMAVRMEELARQQPGFRDIVSVRGSDGVGITVATFDTERDAAAWKRHPEHLEAQRLGRERFYEWYEIQVTEVTRAYGWQRATRIFHIAVPDDWAAARRAGEYTMSTRGRSLSEEGFIHCSFADQVEGTANRYYADLDEVVLLTVDPSRLGSELVVEDPFPGAPQRFPHVYAPIPVAAVVATAAWRREADRPWRLPEDPQGPVKAAERSPLPTPSRPA